MATFKPRGRRTSDAIEPAVGIEFVITRRFAAPRALVFKVWTEPEHLMKWFGPAGTTLPSCKMDLRPGGIFHYCMRMPDGTEMWDKWPFREIVVPERLVLINSSSDANAGATRHPLSATWPLETLSTTTFVEIDGQTGLRLRWAPYNASAVERGTFDSSHAGMAQG